MRTFLLSICFVLAGAALAGEPAVKLTVTEPAGVARRREPASGGVPFKKGQVRDVAGLALFKSGRPVVAQFSRLAGYEDGSVQWALVDVLVDVPAGGAAEFVVRKGRAAAPARPIKIAEKGGKVIVETGPAKFTVNKGLFNLLQSVELGDRKVAGPGSVEVATVGGKVLKAGRPYNVSWEYRGPVRSTLRVDGIWLDGNNEFLRYTTRLSFWAGLSAVRVEHSIRNSNPREGDDAKMKWATVSLAFKGAQKGGDGKQSLALGGEGAGLLVTQRHSGGCFPGGGSRRVPARYKMAASGGRVTVWAVPPGTGGKGVYGYGDGFFALADCAHKDTEIWFDFSAGAPEAGLSRARISRLHALADGAWVSETGAMGYGRFGTLADEIATYKTWGWKGWDDKRKYPRSPHRPEAYVAKESIHDVSEADSAECYLLMYLRTGERGYLDLGRAWAEYHKTHYAYRTDGFKYRGSPRGPRTPSKGLKVGWYGPKEYGWSDSRSEKCHFYARGIFDYYCLTGDVDALEGGRDLVEQVMAWSARQKPGKAIGYYGCRGFARMWLGALRLAQLTREKQDVANATGLARVVLKASDWDERGFIYWGAGPGYMAGKQFAPGRILPGLKEYMDKHGITLSKKGILADRAGNRWPLRSDGGTWQQATMQMALERYWRLTGDEEARKRGVKMAEFARDFQFSKESRQSFYYTILDIPVKGKVYEPADWDLKYGESGRHSGSYTRFTVGVLARAYSMTGDTSWLEWAKTTWNRGSKRGYRQTKQSAADDEVYRFAWHNAPKDDAALSTARMFYCVPRAR